MSQSTATLTVNANTSAAQSAFSALQGTLGGTSLAFNETKKAVTDLLGILNQGMDLAKFSAEAKNMAAALPTGALIEMQKATEGTVSSMALMQLGMKNLNGEMHATSDGMRVVLENATMLHDKGFGETTTIAQTMFDALRTGRTKELAQFGIALTDTGDKTKNVQELLVKLASTPHFEANPDLVQIERLQAATTDWINGLKSSAGEALSWLGVQFVNLSDQIAGVNSSMSRQQQIQRNAQANALSKYYGLSQSQAGDALGNSLFGGVLGGIVQNEHGGDIAADAANQNARFNAGDIQAQQAQQQQQRNDILKAATGGLFVGNSKFKDTTGASDPQGTILEGIKDNFDKYLKGQDGQLQMQSWMKAFGASLTGGRDAAGTDINGGFTNALARALGNPQALVDQIYAGTAQGRLSNAAQDIFAGSGIGQTASTTVGAFGKLGAWAQGGGPGALTQAQQGTNASNAFAAALGGPAIGKDANGMDSLNVAGAAMGTLNSALTSGIDAAITGHKKLGQAIKDATAQSLLALGKEAEVRAAFNLAMGLGSLFFNPAGAAAYFASAAEFGIAGGLALAGAAALGGGGSSGGSASASSSGGVGAGQYTSTAVSGTGSGASGSGAPYDPNNPLTWPSVTAFNQNQPAAIGGAAAPITINITGALASDQKSLTQLITTAYNTARQANVGNVRPVTQPIVEFS